jgi:hypothetical protein
MGLVSKFRNTFNIFANAKEYETVYRTSGSSYSGRPDRARQTYANGKTIISAINNRIAVDAAKFKMEAVLMEQDKFVDVEYDSSLNRLFTVEANIDQAARTFRQDMYARCIDKGVVAIVPTDYNKSPWQTDSYEIYAARCGTVTQWYPQDVEVEVYNEQTGMKEKVKLPKRLVGLVENPFYNIMNEPNSTLQRLNKKLSQLDITDDRIASGKLDIIIQLPYPAQSKIRMAQAEQRKGDIAAQLAEGEYGIAYIGAEEKVTQLNRPAENNLQKEVEYLTELLFSQIGMTQSILDGTADEQTLNNYYERTIEPLVSAVTEELSRKFYSLKAQAMGKRLMAFNDPFGLVPTSKLPELADKLIRNQVVSSNEFRGFLGLKPSDDPKADELSNPNISHPVEEEAPMVDSGDANFIMEEEI